ncbi:MAG: AraC family transcriptional regulator, partial [Clostridiales bacterium]|nr:AraC family transcriptional regulator [Clostridiales bacterium]
ARRTMNVAGLRQITGTAMAGSKYGEVIRKAQDYIKNNYSEQDISLHLVAKEVNISPNHFSTIFSQETGETFINYITRVRLDHAKALLKTTQMRTSEIGYEVGYNDTHYFSYVFKKNTGMTPKEYRAGQ